MAEDVVVNAPRWRRWGKEALWLLLMVLVISTLLDLWRSPSLPAGAMEAPLHPAGWHHHQPGRAEPRQAAAGLLLGQLVRGVPLHHADRGEPVAGR